MPLSSVAKIDRDGVLVGRSLSGTFSVTLQFESGDFTLAGLSADQNEVLKFLDRGEPYSNRYGDHQFPTGTFTAHLTELSDAANSVFVDLVLQQNQFSAAVSTLGVNAEVYALDLEWTIAGVVHGDGTDHVVTATDCYVTLDLAEGRPDTVSFSYEVLGDVTMT